MKKRAFSLILVVALLLSLAPRFVIHSYAAGLAAKPKVQSPGFSELVIQYEVNQTAKPMTVLASKSDAGELSYQWYCGTDTLKEGTAIDGATTNSYTPDTSLQTDICWYYCRVTNTLQTDSAYTDSLKQAVVVGSVPTVTAYISITNDDRFVVSENTGDVIALKKVTVPYFDLALYGLEQFYFSSEHYGSNGDYEGSGQPGSNLQAGTSAFAYGKVTVLHLYLYMLEVYYCGIDPKDAGQGYLYNENLMGSDVLTITGSTGSLYMSKFWGHDENLTYYHNFSYPLASEGWGSTSDQILLHDNDIMTLSMYSDWSFYSDPLAGYHHLTAGSDTVTTSVTKGDSKTLTLYRAWGDLTTGGATSQTLITTELPVYYVSADQLTDGDVSTWTLLGVTDENGEIEFDSAQLAAGEYYVCVSGQEGSRGSIVSCAGGILVQVTAGVTPGDANGDGSIDSSDAVTILRYLANNGNEVAGQSIQFSAADVNGDGVVNSTDAVFILRYLAQQITAFPCQQ